MELLRYAAVMAAFSAPLGLPALWLLVPVGVDGIAQYHFGFMSTNTRRFATGFIGGLSVLSGDLKW